jgi:hypothetical protein
MINLALMLAAALAVGDASPPPAAAVNAAAPAHAQGKTAADPNKMVCKSIIVTGTRFPTKDCRTQADWDQMALESKKVTADSQMGFTPNRH